LSHSPRSHGISFLPSFRAAALALFLLLQLLLPPVGSGYAVLAHQALIDTVWETHLRPLLLAKYPNASELELSAAQAYAYGGSIVQDLAIRMAAISLATSLTMFAAATLSWPCCAIHKTSTTMPSL